MIRIGFFNRNQSREKNWTVIYSTKVGRQVYVPCRHRRRRGNKLSHLFSWKLNLLLVTRHVTVKSNHIYYVAWGWGEIFHPLPSFSSRKNVSREGPGFMSPYQCSQWAKRRLKIAWEWDKSMQDFFKKIIHTVQISSIHGCLLSSNFFWKWHYPTYPRYRIRVYLWFCLDKPDQDERMPLQSPWWALLCVFSIFSRNQILQKTGREACRWPHEK